MITKVLARDWLFEINTGTDAAPVWTQIKSINTFSPSPTKNDADTTTFDEQGRLSHLPASRGDALTLEGFYLEDEANGDRDPGQEAVENLGTQIGPSGLGQFRMTSPGGTTRTFDASANVTIGGGGNDDPSAWSAELTISGAVTVA